MCSIERYTLHTRLVVRDRAYLIAQHSVIHDNKTNEKHIHIYEQRIFSIKWYTRPNMQAITLLLLQRPPRDILPKLHPLEMYALHPLVRLRDRLFQRGRHGRGSNDATS